MTTAVVGLGLVGSAALRHLSEASAGNQLSNVIGIGPGEPDDTVGWNGPYASWFDSGRITRHLDARLEWAILARRAISAYRDLESRTGVDFHRPSGLVFVRNDPTGIANQRAVAEALELPVTVDTAGSLFPDFGFPAGWTALHEPAPAGHIDPRRMRQAELKAAAQAGATMLDTWVDSMTPAARGWTITTGSGDKIAADRVLMATGSYANSLLPGAGFDDTFSLSVRPEAVVLGEVSEEVAQTLHRMPSMIYLLDRPELDDVYIVPPTQYPDGRWYIKMGGSHIDAAVFDDLSQAAQWMSSNQCDERLDLMREVLTSVAPDVKFDSWLMKPCLVTDTASGLPYIDQITDDLFVAVGGNGHSAKSADGIGALAASLVQLGEWTDPELDAHLFAARFGPWRPGKGSRHGN